MRGYPTNEGMFHKCGSVLQMWGAPSSARFLRLRWECILSPRHDLPLPVLFHPFKTTVIFDRSNSWSHRERRSGETRFSISTAPHPQCPLPNPKTCQAPKPQNPRQSSTITWQSSFTQPAILDIEIRAGSRKREPLLFQSAIYPLWVQYFTRNYPEMNTSAVRSELNPFRMKTLRKIRGVGATTAGRALQPV
jgi:hypothetical protein